jgi:hypothetical protein
MSDVFDFFKSQGEKNSEANERGIEKANNETSLEGVTHDVSDLVRLWPQAEEDEVKEGAYHSQRDANFQRDSWSPNSVRSSQGRGVSHAASRPSSTTEGWGPSPYYRFSTGDRERKSHPLATFLATILVLGLGVYIYAQLYPVRLPLHHPARVPLASEYQAALDIASTPQPKQPEEGGLPVSKVIPHLPATKFLTIATADGDVKVRNFYLSDPKAIESGDIVIKDGEGYWFTYTPRTNRFWIGISGIPFKDERVLAEADFLATLGLDHGDACKLDVTEGIPYRPNDPNNAVAFPLTFCLTKGY